MSGFFTLVVPTTCVVCGGGTPLVNSVYGYVHGRCEATAASIVQNYVTNVEADTKQAEIDAAYEENNGKKYFTLVAELAEADFKAQSERNRLWLSGEAKNHLNRKYN